MNSFSVAEQPNYIVQPKLDLKRNMKLNPILKPLSRSPELYSYTNKDKIRQKMFI